MGTTKQSRATSVITAALITALLYVVGINSPVHAVGADNPTISRGSGAIYHDEESLLVLVDFENSPDGTYNWQLTYPWSETVAGTFSLNPESFRSKVISVDHGGIGPYQVQVTKQDQPEVTATLNFSIYAPACSMTNPTRVSLTSAYVTVQGRLAANCTRSDVTSAAWDVEHYTRAGLRDIFVFSNRSTATIRLYDTDPLGKYSVGGRYAFDTSDREIPQRVGQDFILRLGSRASLSATRAGAYVTLKGTVRRYSPSANAFRPWGQKSVLVQSRCPSCTTWRTIKQSTTSRTGTLKLVRRAAATAQYRIVVSNTSTTWGTTSPTVKR